MAKQKLSEGYPTCDEPDCGKLATINLQQTWHRYDIEPDEQGFPDYTEAKSWDGDDNEFWCEKHAEKEGLI